MSRARCAKLALPREGREMEKKEPKGKGMSNKRSTDYANVTVEKPVQQDSGSGADGGAEQSLKGWE